MDVSKERTTVFAQGMGYTKQFWIFLIGCVLGVVVEVFWGLLQTGRLESRSGLIYGPFNPVYGFGALLMTLVLYRQKNHLSIFLGSMVIGATFEFICSWFQEMAFGMVSWEYSQSFMNIDGRTNLAYAIAWGFLGLFYIRCVFPVIERWIEKIPASTGKILTILFTLFMIFNIAISSFAIARQTERREGVMAKTAFAQFLDQKYPDNYLKTVYPNMLIPPRE